MRDLPTGSAGQGSPRVSVLMPVYNVEKYLQAALASVLAQTFADFELIALDDGSKDRSVEVIRSFRDGRIRLIENGRNRGLIDTLNRGLEEARGEYVARQDGDDIALPERFAKQVRVLDESPSTVLVGSWLRLIDSEDRETGEWRYPADPLAVRWGLLFNSAAGHSSVMFRSRVARALGGYSRDRLHAEDYDLWSRMSEMGDLRNVPEVLERYRVHASSVTSTSRAKQEETRFAISKRNIERLLDRDVEASLVARLDPGTPVDAAGAIGAFKLLKDLHAKFLETHRPSAEALAAIEEDFFERVSGRLATLPPARRVVVMARAVSMLPKRFLLSGRCLASFVKPSIKQGIKGALLRNKKRALARLGRKVEA